MPEVTWFETLTGFPETTYPETRARLEVVGDRLRSKVNGHSYGIGSLEVVSLAELRRRVGQAGIPRGRLAATPVTGDVREMHRDPRFAGALFQVASQFNLLEMASPALTPEHGVTRYASDPTQGPACAIAAGAATLYRNYFAPVGEQLGQTTDRQIDCLAELGQALGNEGNRLWKMRNGYALCTSRGLAEIRARLAGLDEAGRDDLRAKLRIGVHWNVEVTDRAPSPPPHVSQAFCSALPVAYGDPAPDEWADFACLVLEAAYEATLLAACLNARPNGSKIVLLTRLGGGAFGNKSAWIDAALRRALEAFRDAELDVRLVSRATP